MKNLYFVLIIIISTGLYSQEFIEIIKPDIHIRMSPSTSSPIIAHAFNGEVYITNGENSSWYSILLPSGETRWIYKRLAKRISFNNNIPSEIEILKIQEELEAASDQANQDANNEEIEDLNKIEINNILFDRYVLLVLQNYNLSTVFYKNIISYSVPEENKDTKIVAEYMVSVDHIDYDLFKIEGYNYYIETRRCFKLGKALDAIISMYYVDQDFIQKLCFEDGYGKGFENCYNIKNIYSSVLEEPNLVVLTNDGKMKKSSLILKESILDLPSSTY
ncbi:MAG: hypothetical protein CMP54_00735 [Flavobacteriales bacterium]|nr:hypothetical protein [Flavobacteriales bacterium]